MIMKSPSRPSSIVMSQAHSSTCPRCPLTHSDEPSPMRVDNWLPALPADSDNENPLLSELEAQSAQRLANELPPLPFDDCDELSNAHAGDSSHSPIKVPAAGASAAFSSRSPILVNKDSVSNWKKGTPPASKYRWLGDKCEVHPKYFVVGFLVWKIFKC
jgi:hypothetical protein